MRYASSVYFSITLSGASQEDETICADAFRENKNNAKRRMVLIVIVT